MRRALVGILAGIAAGLLAAGPVQAQDTVKIGVILPFSGQFADPGAQIDNGIKLYMKQHGDTVAGKKIEIIRKDTGGIAPDVAKRLAQELIVRDKVDILAGFSLTPNALAAADVSAQAKKFMVVMNAATVDHHDEVALHGARVVHAAAAQRAARHLGLPRTACARPTRWCRTSAPATTRKPRSRRAFKEAGGEIVGSVRYPVANPDFSAFVQRAKDLNPEAIFIFVPGGAQPAAIGKALAERGIDPSKTKIMAQGELTDETALKSMGDVALGIITVGALRLQSQVPAQRGLRQGLQCEFKRNPDFFAVGGYDGMHLIYEALKKTGGKTDGDALIARRQGHEVGKPARPDVDRSGDPRRRADRLHPPGREGRRPAGQRRVRQARERQGSGQGAGEEVGRWRPARSPAMRQLFAMRATGDRCTRRRPLHGAERVQGTVQTRA